MSLYNLTQNYPTIDESYFATLPMTRLDEQYLRPLSKHQLSVLQFESSCKGIIYNIVSYLASPKPVKPITEFSISIEATVYVLYFLSHSIVYILNFNSFRNVRLILINFIILHLIIIVISMVIISKQLMN